jgi:hypothetical protein
MAGVASWRLLFMETIVAHLRVPSYPVLARNSEFFKPFASTS